MRVYFAPCGIGLGHAARLLPIAERLQKEGAIVNFSTYEDPIEYVKARGFHVITSPPIRFQYREDGIFDVRRTFAKGPRNLLNFMAQVAFETTTIEALKPDVVVSDSRLSSLVGARIMNTPRILIINQLRVLIPHVHELTKRKNEIKSLFERVGLEILTTLWHSAQRILVPDFPSPYTISKANLTVTKRGLERVSFIGPLIGRRPNELPPKASLRQDFDLPARKPVIFANYNGTPHEKAMAAQNLDPLLERLKNEFCVVISHGVPSGGPLNHREENFRLYNWLPEKYEMLRACDIFVSTCGHTSLAEALYYGVPTIMIPTPGHTERMGNAASMEEFGASLLLSREDLAKGGLSSAVHRISDDDSFQRRASEIQRDVSGMNAIETAISEIRGARKEFT